MRNYSVTVPLKPDSKIQRSDKCKNKLKKHNYNDKSQKSNDNIYHNANDTTTDNNNTHSNGNRN